MSNGPNYRIELDRVVHRTLRRLPKDIVGRLQLAIDALAENPRPVGYKRLQTTQELYRIRVSDWRIIYRIHDDILVVVVVRVGARGDVYRGL
jgi:mRNA interferase RelE/StbE